MVFKSTSSSKSWYRQGWFFLIWALLVFSFYFSLRSLFDLSFVSELAQSLGRANRVQFLLNWAEWLKAAVVSGLAAVVFLRLGRRLRLWLDLETESPTLTFCIETALGLVFLNGLWMGLGLNDLWFKPLILTMELLLAIWALMDLGREGIRWSPIFTLKPPQGSFFWITLLAMAFVGFNYAQCLLPETYFDALVYHLSTLQFWNFHHGLADLPGNLYAHFPFGAELYLWNGFLWWGSQATKFLNVEILILTALSAGAWVAEMGSLAAGGLTTASILFLPLLSTTTWATQNDVFVAFFFLLFVYALLKGTGEKNTNWFIFAGLMGGMAWSAKYTAILGLGIAFLLWFGMGPRLKIKHLAASWVTTLILIILAIIPWALKNYFFAGNFFYPYLSHWLGGERLPAENASALLQDHETPWVMNHSFGNWIVQVFTKDLDKTITPLLVAFIPFVFFKSTWKDSSKYLLTTSLVYLLLGFGLSHQLRLVIPALVLILTAIGMILSQLGQEKIRSWSWVVLAFGLLSFISLIRVGTSYYHWGEMATGFKSQNEFLETSPQTQTYFPLTEAAQVLTLPTDRLLIVGDSRSLYFPRESYSNSVFDRQLLSALAQDEKDSDGIRHRLKELGIDDIVVSGEEGQRLSSQNHSYYPLSEGEWVKLDGFIQRWTDPRFMAKGWGIYHLSDVPLSRKKTIPDLLFLMKTPKLN